jgi:hypothetical protein
LSILDQPPKLINLNWLQWAQRTSAWLALTRSALRHKVASESAADDGVMLWDNTGYPVVSKNGAYRQIVLADGFGNFSATADIVAASPNTAYSIAFTASTADGGISLNASDNTRIDFAEAGVYSLSGHLQLKSTSASTKTLYWWVAINGSNTNHSERMSLHNNNGLHILGVSDQLNLAAGDYINVKWATDDVDLFLDGSAATAFAPASEPINLSITRSRQ